MAVAYKSGIQTGQQQVVSTLPVNVPVPNAIGDVAVCVLSRWSSSVAHGAVDVPDGFVEFGAEVATTNALGRLRFYYRRFTAVEPSGTYDFSWSGAMSAWAQLLLFSGVTPVGDPVGELFTSVAGVFGYTVPVLSLTVDLPPGLIYATYNDFYNVNTSHVPPTYFTELYDSYTGATNYYVPGVAGTFSSAGAHFNYEGIVGCAALFALVPPDPIAMSGDASAAESADADLIVMSPAVPAVASASGAVGISLTLSSSAEGATGASAELVCVTLFDGATDAASSADATLTTPPPISFDGAADAASSATGSAGVTHWLDGAAFAVVDVACAFYIRTPGPVDLDGAAEVARSANAAVVVSLGLAGAVLVAADISAEVGGSRTVVDLAGAVVAAEDASAALDSAGPVVLDLGATVDAAGWVFGALVAEVALDGSTRAYVAVVVELAIAAPLDLDGAAFAATSAHGVLDLLPASSRGEMAPTDRPSTVMASIPRVVPAMTSAHR